MSIKNVKEILDKASKDQGFRDAIVQNPLKALEKWDLTEQERNRFKNIKATQLVSFKNNLDKRFTKDGSSNSNGGEDWWVDSVTD